MKQNIRNFCFAILATVIISSCSPAEGNFPGSEYMPDMAHSIAVESNVYTYYYLNTWDEESEVNLKSLVNPRLPVQGTVPRGYAGVSLAEDAQTKDKTLRMLRGGDRLNTIAVPVNGNAPYYYADTEEERTRATTEIIENPFPITAAGLEKGEELYNTFCAICHGEKGNGLGYLVDESNPNAVYPAAPANFLSEEFLAASNGRYYHSIMYGKNVMGAYKDKISYEERWQVIHYIRSLQAKEVKALYTEEQNTLNDSFGTPMSQIALIADAMADELEAEAQEEGHEGEEHGEDHDDHGSPASDGGHGDGHGGGDAHGSGDDH